MKKFTLIISLSVISFMCFNSCGPSQKEAERQKRIEDSINKLDSDKSFDDANKLLQQADSIEKAKQDSIDQATQDKGKK
jgi:hypothetical protein